MTPQTEAHQYSFPCRDCGRQIRWCKDSNDTKGPRCFDCMAKRIAVIRGKRISLCHKCDAIVVGADPNEFKLGLVWCDACRIVEAERRAAQ